MPREAADRRFAPSRCGESGVATFYAVAAMAVLLLTLTVVSAGIRLARTQHQAATAADLAALAGAVAASSSDDACGAAQRVASANGGRLTSCRVSDRVVDVLVEVSSTPLWGRTWSLRVPARAGPADAHSLGVDSK